LSGRLAATFAMARLDIHLCCHHFLQSDVGRRGVPVCRDVRSIKVQENPNDTPQKGSVSKTHPQIVTNRRAVPAVYFSICVTSFTDRA
jgi:ssDNA-binding Zn-finger/Zn-ribbon topoisomerase 1